MPNRKINQGHATPVILAGFNEHIDQASLVKIDHVGQGIVNVPSQHEHIHDGVTFVAWRYVAGVANNGYNDIYISVDDTKNVHLEADIKAGGSSRFFIYESPTYTAPAAISEYNVNRQVGDGGNTAQVFSATNSTLGTQIFENYYSGGFFGTVTGVNAQARAEFVLKRGLDYLLRLQNIAGTALPCLPFIPKVRCVVLGLKSSDITAHLSLVP